MEGKKLKNSRTITFGRWEAVMLLLNLINTHILLNFPRSMAEAAGTAGWLLPVYATVITLILFTVISRLYKNFAGMDILDVCEYMGGNIARAVVGCFLAVYILYIISTILREFAEDMKTISLGNSPISFVVLLFVAGAILGAYSGIEAIARISAIAAPLIIIGFIIIIIGNGPYYEVSNLLPILGSGVSDVFLKGALKVSMFSGLLILFFFPPFIKTHKNFKSVGFTAVLISGLFFITSAAAYLMISPYPTAIENFLPIYQMARLINYGYFFKRIEAIFVLIWSATAFVYLSFGLFNVVYSFKKAFKLEYYRPLVIPFAISMFALCLVPDNLMEAIRQETVYIRSFAPFVVFLLPIVILSIANIKKRREKKESMVCEKES